jgi:hypothetical protein
MHAINTLDLVFIMGNSISNPQLEYKKVCMEKTVAYAANRELLFTG